MSVASIHRFTFLDYTLFFFGVRLHLSLGLGGRMGDAFPSFTELHMCRIDAHRPTDASMAWEVVWVVVWEGGGGRRGWRISRL